MEQNEEIQMQLWEYLDGTCSDADKLRISGLIANDHIWLETFNELSALHTSIPAHMELEQPSLRFSKNVMEAVSHVQIAPATKKYINNNIIRGIAAFFIVSIASLLGYAIATTDWRSPGYTVKTPDIVKFNFSSLFNNDLFSIVIVVNILLGLLLIDTLLRRKGTHHIS